MNYQEFNDLWLRIMRQTRLINYHPLFTSESVDLRAMDRTYRVFHHWFEEDPAKLFHVSAEISWIWDALLSARFATTEEDLLGNFMVSTATMRTLTSPGCELTST